MNLMTAYGAGWLGEGAERPERHPTKPEKQFVERPVVFVLPGLGGEEDPELEKVWGPSREKLDIISVRYLDWTDLVAEGCDFATLVDHVRRQIEARLPTGPVRMAGYSIGGHLAYAIAIGFQAEGRPVSCVALLDAPANIGAFQPPLRKRLKSRVEGLLAFNVRAGLASLVAKILISDRARPLLRRFAGYRQQPLPLRFETFLHRKITMQLIRRIFPPWWSSMKAIAFPLTTPTVLFRSEEHEPEEPYDLGWQLYCEDLRVVPVAGSHRGMLEVENNGPLRAAFIDAMKSKAF